MPPRETASFGALFEALIEDLRIQVAASVDRTVNEFVKRLARLERRMDQLSPQEGDTTLEDLELSERGCTLCERTSVARGLCSAHYQQLRYREKKSPRQQSDATLLAS